jgi:hypothetical protein
MRDIELISCMATMRYGKEGGKNERKEEIAYSR